ncbi:unnamed protein product, partial [Ectocarpus sp. 13 AM-2016]
PKKSPLAALGKKNPTPETTQTPLPPLSTVVSGTGNQNAKNFGLHSISKNGSTSQLS